MLIKTQKLKGASLYLTLMLLSVILGIFLSLSSLLLGQIKMFRSVEESVIAFYAADTGIEKNLFAIQGSYTNIPVFDGGAVFTVETTCNPDYDSCSLYCSDCSPDPTCDAPRFCMTSNGQFYETKRAIFVKF